MGARRLRRLRQLGWRNGALLIEATGGLGIARLAILVLPLRWIVPSSGRATPDNHGMSNHRTTSPELPPAVSPALREPAQRVGWAVMVMSRHTPWPSQCLTQAVAARWMLRRRGVPSTLHLGVTRDEPAPTPGQSRAGLLQAHAWLRCGDFVVTGRPGMERYTVLATFAGDEVPGRSGDTS